MPKDFCPTCRFHERRHRTRRWRPVRGDEETHRSADRVHGERDRCGCVDDFEVDADIKTLSLPGVNDDLGVRRHPGR